MADGEARESIITLPSGRQGKLQQFESLERLSELFVITALVVCEEPADFFDDLGKPVPIKVHRADQPGRLFHAQLTDAEYVDANTAGFRYRLTLRPWLYRLSRNLDYAIFQEKSALEIIKDVFSRRGCSDVDYEKLSGSFQKREYCVQYRESDFAFVSRLMEEEGIYYFFRHEESRHTLVLANARSSHKPGAYGSLPFVSPTGGMLHTSSRVWSWSERVSSSAEGQVALHDFDFVSPGAPKKGLYDGGVKTPLETAEVFDYPGGYLVEAAGNKISQTILESARRQRRLCFGEGDAIALTCGEMLKIEDHPITRLNQEYLIVALRYTLADQSFRSGGETKAQPAQMVIEASPASQVWRAPLITPRPVARGPETAIVTGPKGEVIYTDKYGRVKVRFHWDRSASPDEKSTCFIRVSHNSAGAGFGNVILPRLGQEVIVDFINGDPDRPMITGRVYNGARMQTYGLPANKTRSVWRSETVGKTGQDYDGAEDAPGSDAGKNEIRMEDLEGKEELYVHAQRDRKTDVRRDDDFKLGRDQTQRVGRSRTVKIKKDDSKTVETGDETHTVDEGKRTTIVNKDDSLTIKEGKLQTEVQKGDVTTAVNMGNMSTAVKMGNYSLNVDMGSVTIEAMQKIELKVGQSSIVIDQLGVTIKGMMISSKAEMMFKAEGVMTEVSGSAMTTVKGAIVMIN